MTVEICKKFRFEAAHWLPGFPAQHKCHRLHGHSFEIEIWCKGPINSGTGVLIDYGDIKAAVKPYVDALDHHCLNHLGDEWNDDLLRNPSSENLSVWFWQKLKPVLPELSRVVVHETCTSACQYAGE